MDLWLRLQCFHCVLYPSPLCLFSTWKQRIVSFIGSKIVTDSLPYMKPALKYHHIDKVLFFISWRLITPQYCNGFSHTLAWINKVRLHLFCAYFFPAIIKRCHLLKYCICFPFSAFLFYSCQLFIEVFVPSYSFSSLQCVPLCFLEVHFQFLQFVFPH